MRRFMYGFLGFILILLGAALLIPFFVTINDYKPQIVSKAKEHIGRDVAIGGKISLHLLPFPQLSINQVSVGNIPGGKSKDFVRIKRVDVSVELFPLLKKQIKIISIELNQPEIFLEKLPDGKTNWSFPSSSTSESISESTPENAQTNTPSAEIALDKLLIHKGRLVYFANGKDTQIDDINIASKMDTLKGPYALTGTLKAFGHTFKLDTKMGTVGNQQDVNMQIGVGGSTLNLEGKASLETLTFRGVLKGVADPKMFQTVSAKDKPSSLMSNLFHIEAAIVGDAQGFSLSQARFEIGSAKPTGDLKVAFKEALKIQGNLENLPGNGQCTFSISPSEQGMGGTVKASVSKAKDLLSWLEIETKTLPPEVLGALTIKTDFTLAQKIILKNLHLNVQDAKMQGDFSWESQKNGPLVTLDLTTPKIENVMKLLGSKNPKPLGMGKLQGKIQYNPTSLHLTQLKGHLGSNFNFAGDVTIKHGGIKPKINAVLSLKSLNVNTLLASHQINSYPEAKVFLVSKKDVPSSSKWSNDPLDFTILNKFDGNFQITADQLTYKDIAISNPKLTAVIENGLLTVSSLTGSIFEGSFVSMGHLSSKNDIKIHMTLKDANLKGLPTQGSNVKIVAGKLFVSTNLTSRGKNMQALVQNLTGPLRISAKNGVINGFSLQELSQRLGDLKNPASLLGLLNTSMGKGQTPFSSFLSEITFNQGVGTIQSMSLEAQGGRGHASGQINLPQYALNIHAEFRLTDHPKIPPFHMKLTGPIDNPSRTLDTANLQQYMIENVFKGLIGNLGKGKLNPRDVLGSILGGSNAPPQQPQKSSPPSKPEAIVKDIFKGIF